MLQIGEIINTRYRIDAVLGAGAMGVVYKAWDPRIKRHVAVKATALSEKEAEILGKLKHPNIVPVYDLVQHHTENYIVMEYVEGATLEDKLRREGAITWEAALPLLNQVLLAAGYAHKAGVIHRDIKPGNIMITPGGEVKVMDFGLGKILDKDKIARSTNAGGTPYYMSPEQVGPEEKFGPVDQHSDVYSIGMTFYETLAGQTPLKSKTTQAEIFDAIRRDNFPPPRKSNANVPHGLAKIIMKAVAQKQRKRFHSAEEMLAAVERFEIEMRIRETGERPRKFRFRLVREIALGLLSVTLILALITIFKVPDLPLRLLKWFELRSPAKVAVFTEPPGAEIKLGGKAVGKSPLRSYYVDEDTLVVSLYKQNYFRIDSVIALQHGAEVSLSFVLKPSAMFAITVVPESASVLIDGDTLSMEQRRGLELPTGEHELFVALAGYVSLSERISLRQGVNTRNDTLRREAIAAVLPEVKPEPRRPLPSRPTSPKPDSGASTVTAPVEKGMIKLTINPASDVYIDNLVAARAATAWEGELPLRAYNFKVVHPQLGKWLETIHLTSRGVSREIDFTKTFMLALRAFDAVNEKPLTALIYLDGQSTGQLTPYNLPLNFGTREIEVRVEGYKPERRHLNVEKNDEQEFRLERVQ